MGNSRRIEKGIVIEDADENQYVWVPVDGTNVTFGRVDWKYPEGHSKAGQSIIFYRSYSDYADPTLPTELTTSVTTTHGFYIARFEAGVSDAMKAELSKYRNGSKKFKFRYNINLWNRNIFASVKARGYSLEFYTI